MPRKKTKAASGFKGVRARPSGRWSAELQHEGMRYYLGTYDSPDLAARAYDAAGWRLGVPREQLNDPSITCLQDAIFVAPPMPSKVKTRLVKKKEEPARVLETDDEAMARFAREHPEYVQYEQEFFWKREQEMKKKKVDYEAGPLTVKVIELSSSSSFDWNDCSSSSS